MADPKPFRTAAATAAVRRRGQDTKAIALREAGWLALPPEAVADRDLLATVATALQTDGIGCDHSEPACNECLAAIALRTLFAWRTL